MNQIIATLLTLLCLATNVGCTGKPSTAKPKPIITFELPEEWKLLDATKTGDGLGFWDAYLFDPDKNAASTSKFTMAELLGANDNILPGATTHEKAEKYYETNVSACQPDVLRCTVDPIREVDHAGIKAYAVSTDNNYGWSPEWNTQFFFEKNGVMLSFQILDRFEAEITQKTYKKIFETINVSH